MKLVAARDIYNTKDLGLTLDPKDPLFVDAKHIYKGARFSIGTSENYKDLTQPQLYQVGTLIAYGLAVVENDENLKKDGIIQKIDAQARVENEARKKAMVKPLTQEEIIAAAVAKSVSEVMASLGKK